MCPVCIATAALIASSAASTGGLTALAVRKFINKSAANQIPAINTPKEEKHNG
jgi:hypothetical protein